MRVGELEIKREWVNYKVSGESKGELLSESG